MAFKIKRPRIGWRDADGAYFVDGNNDHVCFSEGSVSLLGEVEHGTWSDLELAGLIKLAMDAAAGASGTYASYRDGDQELFFICRTDSASAFGLTVSACASSIFPDIGFLTDRAGVGCFSADVPTPAMVYLDLEEPVRSPAFELEARDRKDHKSLSGIQRSTNPAALERTYEMALRFNSYVQLKIFLEFMEWALKGHTFRWWPAFDEPHRWVLVQFESESAAADERLPVLNSWSVQVRVREAANNNGTIGLEDLQDRGRSHP